MKVITEQNSLVSLQYRYHAFRCFNNKIMFLNSGNCVPTRSPSKWPLLYLRCWVCLYDISDLLICYYLNDGNIDQRRWWLHALVIVADFRTFLSTRAVRIAYYIHITSTMIASMLLV